MSKELTALRRFPRDIAERRLSILLTDSPTYPPMTSLASLLERFTGDANELRHRLMNLPNPFTENEAGECRHDPEAGCSWRCPNNLNHQPTTEEIRSEIRRSVGAALFSALDAADGDELEMKRWIDGASYEALLRGWRIAPIGSPWFQGEIGEYYQQVMKTRRQEVGEAGHVAASKAIDAHLDLIAQECIQHITDELARPGIVGHVPDSEA